MKVRTSQKGSLSLHRLKFLDCVVLLLPCSQSMTHILFLLVDPKLVRGASAGKNPHLIF